MLNIIAFTLHLHAAVQVNPGSFAVAPMDDTASYARFIASADSSLATGDYRNAIGFYNKALEEKPGDTYAYQQVQRLSSTNCGDDVESQRRKIILKGDEYFEAGDYAKARSLYERALAIRPGDMDVAAKLKTCDEKLNNAGNE